MSDINPITINGRTKIFGGYISRVSFSAEFSSPSQISVSIFAENGEYSITDDDLSTEKSDVIGISFGSVYKYIRMFPVKYEISNDAGIRTLNITYEDCSKLYLDKFAVLLYGKHAWASTDRTLVVGTLYEYTNEERTPVDPPLVVDTSWSLGQEFEVKYRFTELKAALLKAKIPLSSKILGFVPQEIDQPIKKQKAVNVLREYSGTLRDVLNSWGQEFGVIFYWNGFSALNKDEGCLDMFEFTKETSESYKSEFDLILKRLKNECAAKSCSQYTTIQNTIGNLSIIRSSAAIPRKLAQTVNIEMLPINLVNRQGKLLALKDVEGNTVTLSLRTRKKDGKMSAKNPTQDELDLMGLMKAVSLGPKFYRYYILLQLLMLRVESGEDISIEDYNLRLRSKTALTDPFELDSTTQSVIEGLPDSVTSGDGKGVAMNALASRLYKLGTSITVTPIFARKDFDSTDYDNAIGEQTNAVFKDLLETQKQDKVFNTSLNSADGGMLMMSIKPITKNAAYLLDDSSIETDIVYTGLKNLLEINSRWFFSSKLITEKKLAQLEKSQDVVWEYAGLSIKDSSLSWLLGYKELVEEKAQAEEPTKCWSMYLKNGEAGDFWNSLPDIDKFENIRLKGYEVMGYKSIPSIVGVLSDFRDEIDNSSFSPDPLDSNKLVGRLGGELRRDESDTSGISCTAAGRDSINRVRSGNEVGDGYATKKTYPADQDWGILLMERKENLSFTALSEKASGNFAIGSQNNKSAGGADSDEEFVAFALFNKELIIQSLASASVNNLFFDETNTFFQGKATTEWVDEFDYGLVTLPELKNKNLSNVAIISESPNQADLLEDTNTDVLVSSTAKKNGIIQGVTRLSEAYALLNSYEPTYGATLEFANIPNYSSIPSIEQGMESWDLSIGGGSVSFTLNIGNTKRGQEKVENIYRMLEVDGQSHHRRRIHTKFSKFNAAYKVNNRL